MKHLESKRIFMVGGPGGVGKTTVAAALGTAFAHAGYKTLVLTVDPARRLASAMGLSGFSSEIQQVKVPFAMKGELFASMLDSKRYFDKVITRFCKTSEQEQKIFSNPIYRAMVQHLSGTHEYAAMERLLEFSKDPGFQKIIVDTPPVSNAVDLLAAPQRLADFMDNSVLKWFQNYKVFRFPFFKYGTRLAMKFIQKIMGEDFLTNFAGFMGDLEGMQDGFRTRNLEVMSLLKSNESIFYLVTLASESRVRECVEFCKTLKQYQIPLGGIFFNRVQPKVGKEVGETKPSVDSSPSTQQEFEKLVHYYGQWHHYHCYWIEKLETEISGVAYKTIPEQNVPIHDFVHLLEVGRSLVL